MAEGAVSELKDSGKEILDKLGDLELFKRENQVKLFLTMGFHIQKFW